jgi:thiosulfate reductase cytochrome b subunit
MAINDRARLIFHGAIVLLAGLLCGYPTVVESLGGEESVRLWHTAHEGR